jgi:alpha-beta hydrolase superfamily lysophospholipase
MKNRPRKIVFTLVRVAAISYVAITGLIWWTQDWLVFRPSVESPIFPESEGLSHEDIAIEVIPGTKIRGWFVPAPKERRGTILYFHGNGGNLSSILSRIRSFAEQGFDSFSIDYEGYGASDGAPSEANLYRDAEAAWEWLTKERGVEPDQIVVWGHSLGGAVAIWCASKHTPRMVLLDSTFTSMPAMGAHIYPIFPIRLIAHNIFDNQERVQKIHVPILIAHSKDDGLIPFEMGQELFSAANEPKRFVELQGNHNDGFESTPAAWKAMIEVFENARPRPE